MLYGLVISFFVLLCLFIIFLVLIQKGKGNAGIGNLGGGTQQLFGGSGGADVLEKATWIAGALFMTLSLGLALYKTSSVGTSKYSTNSSAHTVPTQAESLPVETVPVTVPANTAQEQAS